MPILGYFLSIGGALLTLMFVADAYLPKQAPREDAPHVYSIPIAAAQKHAAPIVFSGETRDFGRPPPMTVVDFANQPPRTTQAAALPAPAQAQVVVAGRQDARPVRKKVARRKVAPENSYAQIPEEWRSRYTYTGMAFARPPGW